MHDDEAQLDAPYWSAADNSEPGSLRIERLLGVEKHSSLSKVVQRLPRYREHGRLLVKRV